MYLFIDERKLNAQAGSEHKTARPALIQLVKKATNDDDYDIFRGETLKERKQRGESIKSTIGSGFIHMYDFNLKKLYKKNQKEFASLKRYFSEGEIPKIENMILDATLTQTLSGFCEISKADTALT